MTVVPLGAAQDQAIAERSKVTGRVDVVQSFETAVRRRQRAQSGSGVAAVVTDRRIHLAVEEWMCRCENDQPATLRQVRCGAAQLRRIVGQGNLWITEYVINYEGKRVYTVSLMEFRDGKVAHETQYFADPFNAPAWRAPWVETVAR